MATNYSHGALMNPSRQLTNLSPALMIAITKWIIQIIRKAKFCNLTMANLGGWGPVMGTSSSRVAISATRGVGLQPFSIITTKVFEARLE
jgi:hypothetical protein